MKGRNCCVALLLALMLTGVPVPMVFAQSIMVEKNLFSPDRKPPSEESQSPAASKELAGLPAKSIQLDGVFIHEGKKVALLRVRRQFLGTDSTDSHDPFPYLNVHEGGSVGDFQVLKIEPSSVTIARNGQQFVISLFAEGKVVPPAAPLPALPSSTPTNQGKQPQKAQKAQNGQGNKKSGTGAAVPVKNGRTGNRAQARTNGKRPIPGVNRGFTPPGVTPSPNASVAVQQKRQ